VAVYKLSKISNFRRRLIKGYLKIKQKVLKEHKKGINEDEIIIELKKCL
jgi:hypothetical protein